MELCLRGTLSELIHHGTPRQLDPLRVVPLARGIARGLLHLHTRRPPILHRDVKPGNVLLGSGGVPKVADFGMSRFVGLASGPRQGLGRALSVGVIGTAAYGAPELMEEGAPGSAGARAAAGTDALKADVYSFGVLLWEMLARKRPHAGLDEFQIQTLWYLDPTALSLPPLRVPDGADAATRHAMRVLQ
ncbi:hypothetical protein H632_c4410p0, partial [Helicosporidium sp. ATCC 50920]